jgi:DNA-directed RNA polymerase sigma subunit (sigma70/sigma32)
MASTRIDTLARYIRDIRRFPTLEPREAEVLARRWREHRERSSADRLITSHLRVVVKIANSYRGYGLPIGEVISQGNLGLMRAVEPSISTGVAACHLRGVVDQGDNQDWLVDDYSTQEKALEERLKLETFHRALRAALNALNAREHRIFVARHLADDAIPLKELGQEFGLSCEGVRRIEVLAFDKMRKAVKRGDWRAHQARSRALVYGGQLL